VVGSTVNVNSLVTMLVQLHVHERESHTTYRSSHGLVLQQFRQIMHGTSLVQPCTQRWRPIRQKVARPSWVGHLNSQASARCRRVPPGSDRQRVVAG
jgi:hypothetical protein